MIHMLTQCQNKIKQYRHNTKYKKECFYMKKNIGSQMALYPTPVVVVGAMNGEKPTWTLVAHVGIIGHDRVLVSLVGQHFINGCIKKQQKLSLNLVQESMLPQVDQAGSVSGAKADKSALFAYTMGESGTPLITDAPLSMECTVADIYETEGFESFICTIDHTYVEEEHLDEAGKISYQTLKPVLFTFPTYEYLKTGDVLGKCLSFGKAE